MGRRRKRNRFDAITGEKKKKEMGTGFKRSKKMALQRKRGTGGAVSCSLDWWAVWI